MKSARSPLSLAIAAVGLLGFVVLGSGMWHKKAPLGGLTQVGRTASVAYEDGSVLNLGESDTDKEALKRNRRRGWNAPEFEQIFIMADGEEINVVNHRPRFKADGDDLSTGDHLMMAANTVDGSAELMLDGKRKSAVVANLQIDGKNRVITNEIDGKDRVITDVIDGKDQVFTDVKDSKVVLEQPVFAVTADQSLVSYENLESILLGGGNLGNLRSPGGLDFGTGTTTGITPPSIGTAVPEPSVLPLLGLAGALGLARQVWRGRAAIG